MGNVADHVAALVGGGGSFNDKLIEYFSTARAVDSAVVHLAGTETITGDKTFSGTTTFVNSSAVPIAQVPNSGAGFRAIGRSFFGAGALGAASSYVDLGTFSSGAALLKANGTDTNVSMMYYTKGTTGYHQFHDDTLQRKVLIVNTPTEGLSVLFIRCLLGGVSSEKQVAVGAVDSGGVGFRTLRVTN